MDVTEWEIPRIEWVSLVEEAEADWRHGIWEPLAVREPEGQGVVALVFAHELPVSGPCRRCGLLPMDYDAAMTPCLLRDDDN